MHAEPTRRWWQKKRWWAAAALWLAIAHPLSIGPLDYAIIRGWISGRYRNAYYHPAIPLYRSPAGDAYRRYLFLWERAACRAEGYGMRKIRPGVYVPVIPDRRRRP